MTCSIGFFRDVPIALLFVTVGLGFLAGRLRAGPIQLGGVCGTLIAALLLGQTGCNVGGDTKDVAFALFIFAMGYAGGPQFFANLNRSSLRYIALPLIEAILVLVIVLVATRLLHLDAGTAAGLAAGAATESAVVGTAAEALRHLNLSDADQLRLQSNIATAYTLTYLIGLISIVFFTSALAPVLLGIDLRKAARELEEELDVMPAAEQVDQPVMPRLVGRAHLVREAAGKTIAEVEQALGGRSAISKLLRDNTAVSLDPAEALRAGDIVVLLAVRDYAVRGTSLIGPEMQLTEEQSQADDLRLSTRTVVVGRKGINGRTLRQISQRPSAKAAHGVFVQSIVRSGHALPVGPSTVLQYGDLITLVGPDARVAAAASRVGNELPTSQGTDLVFLCVGILAGLAIGALGARIGGIPISLGSGGGALVSGLVCGWLNARRPSVGHLPGAAVQLLKDLGLAVFVACVGLSAGPQAIALIREHGVALPLIGLLVSLGPASLSLWVGHKLLKIPGPLLVGAIAGQHVSTPAISAIMASSGSAVPLLGYTVTYAVANVLLPVLGPIIVVLAHQLGG
ncbi:aspartate-alanine antiporter [Bordetella sp. N]|uniref:aspartate-alanine antiporter n=1 Tax=Bordetella sp. N TaxID=1746199 RepID=UPI0007103E0C|nr:aspartate-alanine antiporter [Bordetella sp. N]ALM84058.1 aspartate-alanine antiporter [Bordetella sp. N]